MKSKKTRAKKTQAKKTQAKKKLSKKKLSKKKLSKKTQAKKTQAKKKLSKKTLRIPIMKRHRVRKMEDIIHNKQSYLLGMHRDNPWMRNTAKRRRRIPSLYYNTTQRGGQHLNKAPHVQPEEPHEKNMLESGQGGGLEHYLSNIILEILKKLKHGAPDPGNKIEKVIKNMENNITDLVDKLINNTRTRFLAMLLGFIPFLGILAAKPFEYVIFNRRIIKITNRYLNLMDLRELFTFKNILYEKYGESPLDKLISDKINERGGGGVEGADIKKMKNKVKGEIKEQLLIAFLSAIPIAGIATAPLKMTRTWENLDNIIKEYTEGLIGLKEIAEHLGLTDFRNIIYKNYP